MTKTRAFPLLLLALCSGLFPASSFAQTVKISIPAKSIATGEKTSCSLITDNKKVAGKGNLVVVFTDTASKPTRVPAATVVQVDGRNLKTYPADSLGDAIALQDSLLDATISIMRDDSRISLCDVVAFPPSPQPMPRGSTYTAFAADGEIGKVLRGGSSSALSGSIGMEHRTIHEKWRSHGWWSPLFGLIPFTAQGEEARLFITIAGTSDTLSSANQSAFGGAVLDPKLSGSGFLDGATVEYFPFSPVNSKGGTWGPLLRATIARSLWRIVDTTAVATPTTPATTRTITRALPLTAFDLGLRFAFIQHLDDPKGNNYAMGFDPRFIVRGVSSNTDEDALVINRALGGDVRWRHGSAIGAWLRVRTVTASADVLYLRKHGAAVDGLTGLQSLVKFSYSSWLFVF